jgi:hypothetical protein
MRGEREKIKRFSLLENCKAMEVANQQLRRPQGVAFLSTNP